MDLNMNNTAKNKKHNTTQENDIIITISTNNKV